MTNELRRFPDAAAAAEACAAQILDWLNAGIATQGRSTLAISGGSSPRMMFGIFSRTAFPWDKVHVFWVDERGVPPTDSESNFKLANDTWFVPGQFPAANLHRIQAELPAQTAAERYSSELRAFFGLEGDAMPRFDVIHRGMGPDAHTASLFPDEPRIEYPNGVAAAVWVEKFKQWRITLLPGVLQAAKNTAMLVSGADKAEPLRAVLLGSYDPVKYPAQITLRSENPVVWFADSAAVAQLP